MVDNNLDKDIDTKTENTQESIDDPKYLFDLIVSANKLKVYLRVKYCEKGTLIDPQDIFDRLNEMNIIFGIKENDIINYCKNGEYFKELIAAEGLAPVHGIDARLEYNFKIDDSVEFKEKEDGTIDFKNINNIKSVTKGGLLCTLIPAIDGNLGKDVYGSDIPYSSGKDVALPSGKNTYVSEDNLRLYASVDGAIYINAKNIDINNVYTVKNVDQSTGNIDFVGSVVVQCDVKAGFSVKAKDDIVVKGMVEGATLEAGRDILISNGMNGREVGTLTAQGNVTSKYLENATIKVGKSVYSDAIINCNVFAGENIILKGSRGAIIGGECVACESVQAKNIGTKNNIQTKIEIDLEKYLELHNHKQNQSLITKIKVDIDAKQSEADEINDKLNYLAPFIKKSPANEKLYKLLILKKAEINKEINNLKTSLLEFDNNNKKITDHKIVCSGIMYGNTRIVIGWLRYIVREDLSYTKLYNDGSDIQVSPLLPSDLNTEA